jgi:ribonuclease Z
LLNIVFNDSRLFRILFDAGEGAQRLCVEHRVRLLKVDSICLTKVCPSTCSGLPGLVLTIADIGKKEISILGPPNTAQFWHMTRHFLYRPDFKIKIDEFGDTTSIDYKDFFLHCIPLHYDHNNAKSVCYVCETKEQLGKFDIAKAKALGIPIGPLCSQLKKGNSITLPNGQVILSTDVVGPSLDGRCVAIICDLSDANEDMLLDALTLHPFWNRYAF